MKRNTAASRGAAGRGSDSSARGSTPEYAALTLAAPPVRTSGWQRTVAETVAGARTPTSTGHARVSVAASASARFRRASCWWHSAISAADRSGHNGSPMPHSAPWPAWSSTKLRQTGMMCAGLRPTTRTSRYVTEAPAGPSASRSCACLGSSTSTSAGSPFLHGPLEERRGEPDELLGAAVRHRLVTESARRHTGDLYPGRGPISRPIADRRAAHRIGCASPLAWAATIWRSINHVTPSRAAARSAEPTARATRRWRGQAQRSDDRLEGGVPVERAAVGRSELLTVHRHPHSCGSPARPTDTSVTMWRPSQ